ncbi:MAG: trypsin-like peptidase domain-containing protein [Casimicrobium sp.]
MLTRLWLVFAQVCTICVAILFTVSTLRPEWLARATPVAPIAPVVTSTAAPAATLNASIDANTSAAPQHARSFSEAAKRALPSVVKVSTSAQRRARSTLMDDPNFQRFFGRQGADESTQQKQQQLLGEGSGVIVRRDGYILTNNHVVEGSQQIQVELTDKRVFPAKVIGVDPDTDLAVIKIEGTDFPAITLGDSQALQVADVVLAIGNPFGVFGNTVTMGIVSALGRTQVSESNPFESFIQTDAAINQGNSGGALVNSNGDLIGINSSIFTRTGDFSGIGFAIPTALAKPIMDQLIATGEVKRGYLGVNLGTITSELAQRLSLKDQKGAFVGAVIDGAPGSRAGLRVNDVIVEINGQTTADRTDAVNTIAMTAPAQTIPLKVMRQGEIVELKVTLGKRPTTRR